MKIIPEFIKHHYRNHVYSCRTAAYLAKLTNENILALTGE